ncbi:MAG: VWA domain-containing protein [Burkholderiaceae bacterium]|nr:VWA domain-containing protein [Microbacteriaceae bacterium]
MGLILPWLLAALLIIAALAVLAVVLTRRRRADVRTGTPLAHTDRLTTLPGYHRALLRYRALLAALVVAGLVLFSSAAVLAARPSATIATYPQTANRDIVLCLDVSGSMIDYDVAITRAFGALAEEFDGERVSLVVFNASAVTYFPLTSDYAYIRSQLERIATQFESPDGAYFDGTFFGEGSSLIGDGLAACTLRFDTPDQARSRSIILATDNLEVGRSIFTLPDAGALAADHDIRVYGINPGDTTSRDYLAQYAEEFRQVTTRTGGDYYALDDAGAIPAIVDRIGSQQATVMRGAPQLVAADTPVLPAVLALLSLASIIGIAGRLRR